MKKENNFNVNFIKIFSDNQKINQILNRIGQDQFETEEILSNYDKNGNRHGVILTARDIETSKIQKIIIDAIYGEPNSTQVKDLTYEIGADCDKRIILYTLENPGYTKNEYRHEHEMMKGFAKFNNDCGVETFVVEVSLDSDKTYNYNAEVYPDREKLTLPTKLEFEKAIFNVFYNLTDQFGGYENGQMDDVEGWFSGTYWSFLTNDIDFKYPVWNEDGLFMHGISEPEMGDVNLKWLMDSKIELLKEFFDNREIVIEEQSSGDSVIAIKLWDKPFSYFTNASVKEKERIVESIQGYDKKIFKFWEVLFEKEHSDNEIIKDYGCIPENAFKDLDKEISA